jgi:hypothetical protein
VAAAERRRDRLATTTGARVPRGELVFVPDFPLWVGSSKAVLGGSAAGAGGGPAGLPGPATAAPGNEAFMTLSGGRAQILVTVPAAQGPLVGPDTPATVQLPGGKTAPVRVETVLGGNGGVATGRDVTAVVTGDELLRSAIGANVLVTIEAAATDEPVLAVPAAAVSSTVDGSLRVTRKVGGRGEDVTVVAGARGGGWVAVSPKVPGALGPGDPVVVGAAAGTGPR